jgi:hypothetical protein
MWRTTILETFSSNKVENCAYSLSHDCLTVWPLAKILKQLNSFSQNLMLGSFRKCSQYIPTLVKLDNKGHFIRFWTRKLVGWGIPACGIHNQLRKHVGESTVMTSSSAQTGARCPANLKATDPHSSDVTGATGTGQSFNAAESLRLVS